MLLTSITSVSQALDISYKFSILVSALPILVVGFPDAYAAELQVIHSSNAFASVKLFHTLTCLNCFCAPDCAIQ